MTTEIQEPLKKSGIRNSKSDPFFVGIAGKDFDEDLKHRLLAVLENYDDSKYPPKIEHAKTHNKCTKIGKEIDIGAEDLKFEICPCCGFVEHKPYELSVDPKKISNYGPTLPLFFQFSKFLILITALLCLVGAVGQYYIIQANCESGCLPNLKTLLELGPRQSQGTYAKLAPFLHLSFVVVVCISLLVFYRSQFRLAEENDQGNISPSDYTIMLDNIPEKFKDEDRLAGHLQRYAASNGIVPFKVERICYAKFEGNLHRKRREIDTTWSYIQSIEQLLQIEENPVVRTELIERQDALEVSMKSQKKELVHLQAKLNASPALLNNETAFVTLRTPRQVDRLLKSQSMKTIAQNTLSKYVPCFSCSSGAEFERAPEPDDVLWRHIGHSAAERGRSILVGYLAGAGLILLSFMLQLGVRVLQAEYVDDLNEEDDGWLDDLNLQLVQVGASLLINVINFAICAVLRALSDRERHVSSSHFVVSETRKLVLVFFANSALVTLALYYFRFSVGKMQGVALAVFYLLLSTLVLNPFLTVVDPFYFYLLYQRSSAEKMLKAKEPNYYNTTTQKDFNLLFEEPSLDLGEKYGSLIKTFFVTCFFFYILPIGPVFCGLTLGMQYWADKYIILRRHKKIPRFSKELSLELAEFAEISLLLFTAGNLFFKWKIDGEVSKVDVASVVLTGIILFLPLVGSVAVTRRMGETPEPQPKDKPLVDKKSPSIIDPPYTYVHTNTRGRPTLNGRELDEIEYNDIRVFLDTE